MRGYAPTLQPNTLKNGLTVIGQGVGSEVGRDVGFGAGATVEARNIR